MVMSQRGPPDLPSLFPWSWSKSFLPIALFYFLQNLLQPEIILLIRAYMFMVCLPTLESKLYESQEFCLLQGSIPNAQNGG